MATDTTLIKQYLPESLWKIASSFSIPDDFLKKQPRIIALVLGSKSMDTHDEKQSWFNLLPLMTKDQLVKLNEILTKEKQKLDEIEKKYEEKKRNIKEKYIKRRESMWYEKKMDQLEEKEQTNRQKDLQEAEALLQNL